MRSFYLIRHGETDWNRKTKRLQGHTDIPLNDIGRAQAQGLEPLLKNLNITRFISSDLSRAFETAHILAGGNQPLEKDARLREVKLGLVEGLSPEAVDLQYGADFRKNWGSNEEKFRGLKFPDGESRIEVLTRTHSTLHEYLDRYPNDTLAFVAHGFLIRSLVFENPKVTTDFFVPNCAVAPFGRDAHGGLHYLGPSNPQDLLQPAQRLDGI